MLRTWSWQPSFRHGRFRANRYEESASDAGSAGYPGLRRLADIPDEPDSLEGEQRVVAEIELPPEEALPRRAHVVVVIVVPAFTEREDGEHRVVTGIVLR